MIQKTIRAAGQTTVIATPSTPRGFIVHHVPALSKESPVIGPSGITQSIRRMIRDDAAFNDLESMVVHDSPRVMDIAFDVGKPIVLHFDSASPLSIQESNVFPSALETLVEATETDDHILKSTGRAGIHGTLHRLSMLYDFHGKVVGATLRIGRHLNMHDVLPDDIKSIVASGKSVILFGPPGSGKTTLLRALAEYSGDYVPKRTVVVDASGELGGVGTCVLGQYTRRACVPPGSSMPETMLHSIRNHTPQVLVVDELVSVSDASAAQTCSARGIQLIASCHAKSLKTLLKNPVFRDKLFGGIQHAAIGDSEAKMLGTKFICERKTEPVFDAAYDCSTRTLYESLTERIDELM